MAKPENPPAFPNHPAIQIDGGPNDWVGMTIRDWMAGHALPGILSAPRDTVYGYVVEHSGPDKLPPQQVAQLAYEIADAMLLARQTTDREDGK